MRREGREEEKPLMEERCVNVRVWMCVCVCKKVAESMETRTNTFFEQFTVTQTAVLSKRTSFEEPEEEEEEGGGESGATGCTVTEQSEEGSGEANGEADASDASDAVRRLHSQFNSLASCIASLSHRGLLHPSISVHKLHTVSRCDQGEWQSSTSVLNMPSKAARKLVLPSLYCQKTMCCILALEFMIAEKNAAIYHLLIDFALIANQDAEDANRLAEEQQEQDRHAQVVATLFQKE